MTQARARARGTMASSPVRMILKWTVPPGESRPIVAALQGLMLAARAESGCGGCSLSTELHEKVVIHYIEEWNSEEDLRRQLRSDRFAALAELIEYASEHPTIEFVLPGSTRGVDYAEEIRGSGTR
jgi:quinol monooxygenase YgiN